MKMSDKEFDQLFNAQLADLEMEPSAELWGKIVPEIPGNGKTKSGLAPMLSIAATLLILFTAGLLFMPRTQKLALHGNYDPQQVVNEAVAAVTQQPSVNEDIPDITSERPVVQQPQIVAAVKPVKEITLKPYDTGNTVDMPPQHHDQNNVDVEQKVIPVAVHTENVKPGPVTATTGNMVKELKPEKALAMNNTEPKTTEEVKKHKIRGIAGLLNAVIAKVDKRDNKIIQFGSGNDDDDDELLNVTGVNLGPLKVKKQN